MQIAFGEPDKTWRHYGLEQYTIQIDGENTRYKAIFRHNTLVKVLGSDYYLFSNGEALKMADIAANMAGFKSFSVSAPGLETEGARGRYLIFGKLVQYFVVVFLS